MLVHRRLPPHLLLVPIYTPGSRETSRDKCLAQGYRETECDMVEILTCSATSRSKVWPCHSTTVLPCRANNIEMGLSYILAWQSWLFKNKDWGFFWKKIQKMYFVPKNGWIQKTNGAIRKCSSRAFQWMVMSVCFNNLFAFCVLPLVTEVTISPLAKLKRLLLLLRGLRILFLLAIIRNRSANGFLVISITYSRACFNPQLYYTTHTKLNVYLSIHWSVYSTLASLIIARVWGLECFIYWLIVLSNNI
jgi:hypothetical protein